MDFTPYRWLATAVLLQVARDAKGREDVEKFCASTIGRHWLAVANLDPAAVSVRADRLIARWGHVADA